MNKILYKNPDDFYEEYCKGCWNLHGKLGLIILSIPDNTTLSYGFWNKDGDLVVAYFGWDKSLGMVDMLSGKDTSDISMRLYCGEEPLTMRTTLDRFKREVEFIDMSLLGIDQRRTLQSVIYHALGHRDDTTKYPIDCEAKDDLKDIKPTWKERLSRWWSSETLL